MTNDDDSLSIRGAWLHWGYATMAPLAAMQYDVQQQQQQHLCIRLSVTLCSHQYLRAERAYAAPLSPEALLANLSASSSTMLRTAACGLKAGAALKQAMLRTALGLWQQALCRLIRWPMHQRFARAGRAQPGSIGGSTQADRHCTDSIGICGLSTLVYRQILEQAGAITNCAKPAAGVWSWIGASRKASCSVSRQAAVHRRAGCSTSQASTGPAAPPMLLCIQGQQL